MSKKHAQRKSEVSQRHGSNSGRTLGRTAALRLEATVGTFPWRAHFFVAFGEIIMFTLLTILTVLIASMFVGLVAT
ncbi:MAG: hypothetical protein KGI75_12160, partial [Rhizobiaceae bacterium]|nr:hypothetical protein [Rhizobiaceae bacterium]